MDFFFFIQMFIQKCVCMSAGILNFEISPDVDALFVDLARIRREYS